MSKDQLILCIIQLQQKLGMNPPRVSEMVLRVLPKWRLQTMKELYEKEVKTKADTFNSP